MQEHQNVRTPTDADDGDREWLFVQPTETSDVSIEERDDGPTEITVPISSTAAHRSGSRMSTAALEAMASQLREGTVGLWDDHGLDDYGWPEYRRQDMYGWWVDGEVTDDGVLMGTARLRDGDERSADLVDQLDQGMPVGFSVGYIPLDEEWVEADEGDLEGEEQRVIRDVDLLETSPVGIPDNPNAYADAPARVIAHSLSEAGVSLDRRAASVIGDGVAEALQTMGDDTDPDASDTGTDEEAGDDAGGTEQNEGEEPEQQDYSEEEVKNILDTFAEKFKSAVDEAQEAAAEELHDEDGDGDDDEDDEGEESEGDDPDEDDDDDEDTASVPEDVQAELEELRSKVDRLESENRESAGRKGMAAPGAGDDGETSDGDEQGETNDTDTQRNAVEEAVMMGK